MQTVYHHHIRCCHLPRFTFMSDHTNIPHNRNPWDMIQTQNQLLGFISSLIEERKVWSLISTIWRFCGNQRPARRLGWVSVLKSLEDFTFNTNQVWSIWVSWDRIYISQFRPLLVSLRQIFDSLPNQLLRHHKGNRNRLKSCHFIHNLVRTGRVSRYFTALIVSDS